MLSLEVQNQTERRFFRMIHGFRIPYYLLLGNSFGRLGPEMIQEFLAMTTTRTTRCYL